MADNTPSIPAHRRFRLQISLRMLLALMFSVGVGLTIFRWPWVEVDHIVEYSGRELGTIERRITYRRNWRAEKVKNGRSQSFVENRLLNEENYYEGEFHGSQRYYDRQGRLTIESTFRHGQKQGLFRIGNGVRWIAEGAYANDKRHGEWKYLIDQGEQFNWPYDSISDGGAPGALFPLADIIYSPRNPLSVQAHWRHGKRHGRWTWGPPDSPQHSAEYADDELVRWNNEPVVEQFWQWLRGPEVNDPHLVAEWTAGNRSKWYALREQSNLKGLYFEVADQRLMLHWHDNGISSLPYPESRGRLVPAICEMLACHNLKFAYRYGSLWLVTRQDETPFVDPTGILQIQFPAGSAAERDWNAVVDISSSYEYAPKSIAQVLAGTAVAHEVNDVSLPQTTDPYFYGSTTQRLFTRRRRDVLGYILYATGCRCELQGDVLRILPQPGRTSAQSEIRPLAPIIDPFG